MKRASPCSGSHSPLVGNGAGVAIDSGEASTDMPVGHDFAGVDVGPQIVARHAGRSLDLQDELSGDTLR